MSSESQRYLRTIIIVLDGAGIGALPDAVLYGDEHSNTIGNVAKRVSLAIPTLRALGLGSLVELGGSCPARWQAAIGKMAEVSAGKDSNTSAIKDNHDCTEVSLRF